MNLLKETLAALKTHGLKPEDVLWVGSTNGKLVMDWAAFEPIADRTNYDSGYGGQEIASDLVVVGGTWWLERGEYDGSEWWEFKTMPVRDPVSEPFECVYGRWWKELAKINGPKKPE